MPIYEIQENTERRVITDEEVLATFPPQLIFSADKPQVQADGKDVVTITLQSMSVPLTDDTRVEIHQARTVTILEDGEKETIELDANGHASFKRAFVAAGEYEFKPDTMLAGVGITVKAV